MDELVKPARSLQGKTKSPAGVAAAQVGGPIAAPQPARPVRASSQPPPVMFLQVRIRALVPGLRHLCPQLPGPRPGPVPAAHALSKGRVSAMGSPGGSGFGVPYCACAAPFPGSWKLDSGPWCLRSCRRLSEQQHWEGASLG